MNGNNVNVFQIHIFSVSLSFYFCLKDTSMISFQSGSFYNSRLSSVKGVGFLKTIKCISYTEVPTFSLSVS